MNNNTTNSQQGLTVADLLLRDPKALPEKLQASSTADRLSEEIKAVPGLKLDGLLSDLGRQVQSTLDISIKEVVLRGLNKLREFQEAIDKSKTLPGDTFLVPLTQVRIKSDHSPYVDIFMGDRLMTRVHLHVLLEVNLDGLVLRVKAGEIRGAAAGRGKLDGSVKFEDLTLASRRLIELDLSALFPDEPSPVPSGRS
ncbi:MAG: hypothetical protein R6W87_12850 [Halospina sp.]